MSSRFHFRALFAIPVALLVGLGLVLADGGASHQTLQNPPVKLGTSGGNANNISNAFCCSGTLGSLVTNGATNYILSNNHVLADTDQAVRGEDISQPGLIDVGCNASKAQAVAHFFYAPQLGTANVDAAIADVATGPSGSPMVDTTGAILDIGIPSSTTAGPAVNMGVAKSGRTTGLTCAAIGSVSTNVSVQYQKGCNSGKKFLVTYTNQVVINSSSFSAGGDSGSLIVASSTAQPVALLFAGSSSTTIGNPISDVAAALGVSFVGGADHAVTCPTSGGGGGPKPKPRGRQGVVGFDRALAAKEQYARDLMMDPAIMGVGVGASSEDPSEAVVVIYVEQGRAHGLIPAQLNGVKTEIIRTDRIRAYSWNEPGSKGCAAK